MKQKSIKNNLLGLRAYVFTLLFAVASLSFVITEWKGISRAGETVYQGFKPVIQEWRN
jgi:hypothetical protein